MAAVLGAEDALVVAVAEEADEVEEPDSEAAAPAEDVVAEATQEPEASDEAPAAEDAENADPGTEEE